MGNNAWAVFNTNNEALFYSGKASPNMIQCMYPDCKVYNVEDLNENDTDLPNIVYFGLVDEWTPQGKLNNCQSMEKAIESYMRQTKDYTNYSSYTPASVFYAWRNDRLHDLGTKIKHYPNLLRAINNNCGSLALEVRKGNIWLMLQGVPPVTLNEVRKQNERVEDFFRERVRRFGSKSNG